VSSPPRPGGGQALGGGKPLLPANRDRAVAKIEALGDESVELGEAALLDRIGGSEPMQTGEVFTKVGYCLLPRGDQVLIAQDDVTALGALEFGQALGDFLDLLEDLLGAPNLGGGLKELVGKLIGDPGGHYHTRNGDYEADGDEAAQRPCKRVAADGGGK